ncbi:PRC-barrel domain-containing protein [Paenibacillus validus]|uniref:Photosystem reaction center subunit H n=1 Tax=Paenibacillus validus TaxID=44253 RepID=A0A7X2Z7K3_9BACL|nr:MULTISPECIES: PRC-barrel domain-containing protein [Paenibacillus]MED4603548.1 PRC-barrel domain-containing protein [Paenibacillus validus]MED4608865.1 PRC-barrel domain-containing protein [Paenibacillus validus]MUG69200.1 photosystem reaction center subunit H [Paenibacillus validus]
MRRTRDVIGLPVICVHTGKQVGEVTDLLLDEDWQVQAFLLGAGHWFQEATCVEWEDVIALGEDAVTIKREDAIKPLEAKNTWKLLLGGRHRIKGLPLLTVNGQQLGVVEDVYLDAKTGKKVIGYELTEGFISDLKEGRKWLPMPDSVKVGEDALIVPVRASEALEEIFVPKEE